MVTIVIIISLSFHVRLLHWFAHSMIPVPLILFTLRFLWLLFIHSVCADLLLKGCLPIITGISLLIPILIFKQVLTLKLGQIFQLMFILVLMPQQVILLFILLMVLMAGFKFWFILVFIYCFLPHFDYFILFLL